MPRPRPRRRVHWAAYLWPGLPHLWIEGSIAGLTLALAFSVLLNVLILGVLVWPEWLETRVKLACGTGVALLWLLALWETRGELRRIELRRLAEQTEGPRAEHDEKTDENENDRLLRDAQRGYLCGDWSDAEKKLRKALARNRRDIEARLWYATLLRQTGREARALRQLQRLACLDDAAPWRYEIENEQARCLTASESCPAVAGATTKRTKDDTNEGAASSEGVPEPDAIEQTTNRAA